MNEKEREKESVQNHSMLDFDLQNGFICLHAFQNKTFDAHPE